MASWRTPELDRSAADALAVLTLYASGRPEDAALAGDLLDDLVARPDGVSELYDLKQDPRELHNLYGNRGYATQQEQLHRRMLDWYIRTADVAPKQHDPRGFPKP